MRGRRADFECKSVRHLETEYDRAVFGKNCGEGFLSGPDLRIKAGEKQLDYRQNTV
jgi:hypothetical protein